jgi:AraC-like DNA-binding protein
MHLAVDALSEVLRTLRLRAHVYLHANFCGTWAVDPKPSKKAPFHVIAEGRCWLHMPGESAALALGAGDLVLFPNDAPHLLSGGPDRPGPHVPRNRPAQRGAPGTFTTLMCGRFEFDQFSSNPLLASLPAVLVVRASRDKKARLGVLLHLMAAEAESVEPGGSAVLDKLAEALFVHIVREHLRDAGTESGYLTALADAHVGKAVQAVHERPEHKWTVADLARLAGQSRSAFAERFRLLAGMTPLRYVAHTRMQRARQLLVTGQPVARVAERCGYQTEAAFAKVFKRHFGTGPGAVRRGVA